MEADHTEAVAVNSDHHSRVVEEDSHTRIRTRVVAGTDNRAFRREEEPACSSRPVEVRTDAVDTRREGDRNRPPRPHPVYPDRFPVEEADNNTLVGTRPWEVVDGASDADCQSEMTADY